MLLRQWRYTLTTIQNEQNLWRLTLYVGVSVLWIFQMHQTPSGVLGFVLTLITFLFFLATTIAIRFVVLLTNGRLDLFACHRRRLCHEESQGS